MGAKSRQELLSPGEHKGSTQRKPQVPARWGRRVVGMHSAVPGAFSILLAFDGPRGGPVSVKL
jgi:hypothetical protein